MHYHCEIWTRKQPEDVNDLVDRVMSQNKSLWDWYQVGGRWTGAHDKYQSYYDPLNQGICDQCKGTGTRKDMKLDSWKKQCRGCNSCEGTGITVNYRTVPHDADCLEVSKVVDDLNCSNLIFHGRNKIHNTEAVIVKDYLKSIGITDGYLITVDCHN
jgi:hypothetical protein